MTRTQVTFLVLLAALLAAPFFVYPVLMMKVLCFALFACAFNLLLGFTGLLSFGHAAFFGTAAYATGYAMTHLPVTPEVGLILGTLAAAAL
ncbi:MAG TPA: branched-chain amino acid ABC transporter permease, partial [Burkholderiales bacterium]|nr:branched-chain amino acid ABC transporter permease [Burkholderiales bacterium]